MSSSWLPTWLALAWTAAFVVGLAVHLRHSWSMTGRARLWHLAHVLLAIGMIDMAWPGGPMPVGARVAASVFVLAGTGVVALIVAVALTSPPLPLSWPLAALDLLGMAYLFAQPAQGMATVSVIAAGWFGLETLGWASGQLAGEVPAARRRDPLGGAGVRITLTLMSLGMAYMLLAMQFGMSAGCAREGAAAGWQAGIGGQMSKGSCG